MPTTMRALRVLTDFKYFGYLATVLLVGELVGNIVIIQRVPCECAREDRIVRTNSSLALSPFMQTLR
jgi:hypothetical protein